MGNQQERSNVWPNDIKWLIDVVWLAGIVDGEGSVSVQVYTLPDGRVRLTPFVAIVNTDEGIIAGCRTVLAEIGVIYRDCNKPLSTGKFEGRLKPSQLRIDGQKPVQALLKVIAPYLRSEKRQKAETILKYLESRTERLLIRDELGRVKRAEYSRAEIELIASVRSHKRAKSSEAICQAPNVVG